MANEKPTSDATAEAKKITETSQKTAEAQAKPAAAAPEENVKVVVPTSAKIPESMQAAGPSPKHPSVDAPTISADPAIRDAQSRAQAETEADLDDEDADLNAVSNIGAPVGKPIQCVVRKKFYSEQGQVMVPGKNYYLQLYEGQSFPSDVLEPVDPKLSAKFRKEFRRRKQERAEARVQRERARDAIIAGGWAPAGRARVTEK
jgi:hypothetical protein